ncbi:hypothetical protein E1B28_012798 [Marasmius oreades]|uniref:C2H2-type domain-containing protein n=1 Tax=Marasmius oreades TaxID=181124 RepID=A0A9P7RTM5_9AGAR|nr:uncharacterized protein E1B28_012798 [Marasmius oreades]KAG7088843.1 hypothetical protein E1B28_012798 [Marasmius oreades]
MAPPKSKPQNHPEGEQCNICGVVIARRGDMPRHKRTHAAVEDKNAMLHRCSWEGCSYSSLQRPNVDTHYRTHTKERNQACPDCDSKFSDPGSLIRHRKNLHGYIPKARKTRQRGSTAAPEQSSSTRGSRRHQPYSRSPSTSSSSSGSSSPEPTAAASITTAATEVTTTTSTPTTNAFPVILPPEYDYTAMESIFLSKSRIHEADLNLNFNPDYFWLYQDAERIIRTPSPKILIPATGAGKEFQYPMVHYLGFEITPYNVSRVGIGREMEQPIPTEPLVGDKGVERDRVLGEEKEQPWESFAYQHDSLIHGMPVNDASTFTTTPSVAFDCNPPFVYDIISQLVQPVTPPSSSPLSSSPYNLALDYSQPVGCGSETLEASMFFAPSESAYTCPSEVLEGLASSGQLESGVINYDRIWA